MENVLRKLLAMAAMAVLFSCVAIAPAHADNLQAAEPADGGVPMYRMYNPNTGEHLYTASLDERKTIAKVGWRPEQVGWVAPKKSSKPVYRMYNPYSGDHHYTTDAAERDWLKNDIGWRYEGVGWYSSDGKQIPVYRLFNPNEEVGTHHYTTDAAERDWLVTLGWRYEGVGWHAMKPGYYVEDWVSFLDISKKASQIITVEARGTRATVSLHQKSGGVWKETVHTEDGWVGKQGIGPARAYADYTPTGIMYPDKAFGIKADPGCPLGYLKVDSTHWWVGDPESPLYNKLVSTRDTHDFDESYGEHLANMGSAYDYCLNMGWNASCKPYGGSAFFLHCSKDRPTAGCVSVPESTMVSILKRVDKGCVIVIDTPSGIMGY